MHRRRALPGLTLTVLCAGACADPTLRPAPAALHRLREKGPYQSLYGTDGRIERLLHDRNGDRVADAVLVYDPDGRVIRAELDLDLDRTIDRWEYFAAGRLARLGFSRRRNGVPDTWDVVDRDGALATREFDDDGDGRVDRRESLR